VTDRDALLAAILANPDDDLPRLVYADWLDENGPALPPAERKTAGDRAAFIRAQVEAARAEPFSPAARAAQERADRLLTSWNREAWTWHLRGKLDGAEFVRGFVGVVNVDAARFLETADAIFAAEPVRAIRLARSLTETTYEGFAATQFVAPLEPVFEVPRLNQVTALDLSRALMTNTLEFNLLVQSPHLAGLRDLSLRGNPVPPRWLTWFLTGTWLPELTALDLSDIPNLGPALTAGFRKADHRRFTRLDLSGVAFNSDDLMRVLQSPCLSQVEELRLGWGGGPLRPGPLTRLDMGWILPWGRLRLLDLAGHGLGPEGVREIVRTPDAAKLRWLGLAANGLGPEGVSLLASAPRLDLFYLDVSRNGLEEKHIAALRKRFPDAEIVA
jgi:uncharacterized protein (TIGR02996 family)